MDKANQAVTYQTARDFVENTLGFGPEVPAVTLTQLFNESGNISHYGSRNDQQKASINAITKHDWDAMHFNEKGIVYVDVLPHPLMRVRNFIDKELAKKGLAASEIIRPDQGQKLQQILRLVKGFYENYKDYKAAGAKLYSSVTIRFNENNNWDMLLRIAMFAPDEVMYVEFNFPNLIHTVEIMISDDQLNAIHIAVYTFLQSFNQHSKLFRNIEDIELSKLIAHAIIADLNASAGNVYDAYYSLVQNNIRYLSGEKRELANRVVSWNMVPTIQRAILLQALEIARAHVKGFIDYNVEVAKED